MNKLILVAFLCGYFCVVDALKCKDTDEPLPELLKLAQTELAHISVKLQTSRGEKSYLIEEFGVRPSNQMESPEETIDLVQVTAHFQTQMVPKVSNAKV